MKKECAFMFATLTGFRTLQNFPIRSTTHASCCGTKRTTVFIGRLVTVLMGIQTADFLMQEARKCFENNKQ